MRVKVGAGSLLSAAVLLAGCGGAGPLTKSQYEQQLQAEGKSLEGAFKSVSATGATLQQLAVTLDRARARLASVALAVARLKAPREVAADNRKLADSLHKLATQVAQLEQAAAKGDAAAARRVAQEISSGAAIQEGKRATSDMKAKGYRIGQLGNNG